MRGVLDRDQVIADPADMAERADGLGRVLEQRAFEFGIGPGLGNNARAIVRADLGLVSLDDGVERSRLDIALFGEHRLERAHAQLDLGQLRMVVIMMMLAHAASIGETVAPCRDANRPTQDIQLLSHERGKMVPVLMAAGVV